MTVAVDDALLPDAPPTTPTAVPEEDAVTVAVTVPDEEPEDEPVVDALPPADERMEAADAVTEPEAVEE